MYLKNRLISIINEIEDVHTLKVIYEFVTGLLD